MANDSQARERFEQEARSVAALNPPHICTLSDIGNQDGVDFLSSSTGRRHAERTDTCRGSAQAGDSDREGVADAIRHGILHRDLKPEKCDADRGRRQGMDLGLAKSMNAEPGVTSTNAGMVVGTVAYMSPSRPQANPWTLGQTFQFRRRSVRDAVRDSRLRRDDDRGSGECGAA